MGEATMRGSLGQRQAEGAMKRQIKEQAKRELIVARQAKITPEERDRNSRTTMLLATVLGMSIGAIRK